MEHLTPGKLNLLTKQQVDTLCMELYGGLQRMSARANMLACELQIVDKDNKIFDMTEGVLDTQFLYLTRRSIQKGLYKQMRDRVRIPRRNQAPGHQKEL